MKRYNADNVEALKEFLYSSNVHDAKLESVIYDCHTGAIRAELFNPMSYDKTTITFLNTRLIYKTEGSWLGNRDVVLSLTLEEDFSYLQQYLSINAEQMEKTLYLVLQMFSGDEVHIVSKEVIFDLIG